MTTKPSPASLGAAPAYFTELGTAYCGDSRDLLNKLPDRSVNLVITSPRLLSGSRIGDIGRRHSEPQGPALG